MLLQCASSTEPPSWLQDFSGSWLQQGVDVSKVHEWTTLQQVLQRQQGCKSLCPAQAGSLVLSQALQQLLSSFQDLAAGLQSLHQLLHLCRPSSCLTGHTQAQVTAPALITS